MREGTSVRNLFAANWFCLRRQKAFWTAALFLALYGVFEAVGLSRQGTGELSDGLFAGVTFLGVVLAVFCSFCLGSEYQEGTLRNKVAAGYRRSRIYLAYLTSGLAGGLMIWCAYLLGYLAAGIPLMGTQGVRWTEAAGGMLGILLLVYVALYTCLGSLCHSKAAGTAAAILLAFAMLFGGLFLYARLDEPPVYSDQYTQVEGQTVLVPGEENPYYLRGTERKVYEILYDLLPDGQGMQLLGEAPDNPQRIGGQAGYALLLAGGATALGLGCFRKKDLR